MCLEPNAKGDSRSIHEVACPALCTRQSDSFQPRDSTNPRCLLLARWAFSSMLLNISQAQTKKSCTLAVGDEGAIADVDEYAVQELISPSAHGLHREAPFACPDPECSPFFSERSSLRWHIKFEHFRRWSPKIKLNRSRGKHNREPCVQLKSRLRDMEAAMCCTLILQRSSRFIKGIMYAATSRRSRICKGPVTRTW